MANLEIAEMCARSGANCGSLFLDLRFRELVKVRAIVVRVSVVVQTKRIIDAVNGSSCPS